MPTDDSQSETGAGPEIWRRWWPWVLPAVLAVAALILYGGL